MQIVRLRKKEGNACGQKNNIAANFMESVKQGRKRLKKVKRFCWRAGYFL